MALCPAHDDKNPSLSLTDGENGNLLAHCHAGCDQVRVIKALKDRGLWPSSEAKPYRGIRARVVSTYDYLDPETGELRMQVVRYYPKDFRQRRPDGNGGWLWRVGPEHRLLYNLPAVVGSSDVICVVEGEKDVDALSSLGILSTCSPGGAGKWEPGYNQYLRNRDICIIPDNDKAGEHHAQIVAKHLYGVARSIRILRLPNLPDKGDVSDFLQLGSTREQLKELISKAPTWEALQADTEVIPKLTHARSFDLQIGSDVEIAKRLKDTLGNEYGPLIFAENAFWRFAETHWGKVADQELRLACHRFDGATYFSSSGRPITIKLNKSRLDSIINECAILSSDPAFFSEPACGINCASGSIRFDSDGVPALEPHNPDHRCRHVLPGHWPGPSDKEVPPESLLGRLLKGAFKGEEDIQEKIHLLAQLAGATALGYATKIKQPRAAILYGLTAENGKSQILDVLRGLLPPSAVCSIAVARMSDEKHVVGLAGKLLNASDELSGDAVASDVFKAVVTGEPIEGRDVFKSRVEFRPQAQHIFATNVLPPFKGGIDRGVQRRLLVIPFQRIIPLDERIENIGRRIPLEESDLLLMWAIGGASSIIKNRNYSVPVSCTGALNNWALDADPVLAWLQECTYPVDAENEPGVSSRFAYNAFVRWAEDEGFPRNRLPSINSFSQRVRAFYPNIRSTRTSRQRFMHGFAIKIYDSALTPEW